MMKRIILVFWCKVTANLGWFQEIALFLLQLVWTNDPSLAKSGKMAKKLSKDLLFRYLFVSLQPILRSTDNRALNLITQKTLWTMKRKLCEKSKFSSEKLASVELFNYFCRWVRDVRNPSLKNHKRRYWQKGRRQKKAARGRKTLVSTLSIFPSML